MSPRRRVALVAGIAVAVTVVVVSAATYLIVARQQRAAIDESLRAAAQVVAVRPALAPAPPPGVELQRVRLPGP